MLLQESAHQLSGHGRPGAVLDDADLPLLIVFGFEVTYEFLHDGEYPAVEGGGGKDGFVISERVLNGFSHIRARKIGEHHLFSPALQFLLQSERGGFGVAVNARVCDEGALVLGLVLAPCVIQPEIISEVAVEDGSVKRTDDLYRIGGELFQDGLHLCAVFAHYVEIVSARFARPVIRLVDKRAEFAESVRREQRLVLAFVAHHDLGPMHHGSGDEGELVLAERELVSLLYHKFARELHTIEVAEHIKHFPASDHRDFGVFRGKGGDSRRVIGLHVRDDEVIGLSAVKRVLDIFEPLRYLRLIHGVHDRCLLVRDDVGVVAHPLGHDVLPFKEVDIGVVHAHINDVFELFHIISP